MFLQGSKHNLLKALGESLELLHAIQHETAADAGALDKKAKKKAKKQLKKEFKAKEGAVGSAGEGPPGLAVLRHAVEVLGLLQLLCLLLGPLFTLSYR